MTMGRITIDAEVMRGKAAIRGRCIPVDLPLRKLSEGATPADPSDDHPRLSAEGVHDALAHAADPVSDEEPPR
jgi:uncharacterized protein (DUF433 family)